MNCLAADERDESETHDDVLFQYLSSFKIVVTFNTARLGRKTLLDSSLANVVNKPASGLVRFSYKLSVFQIVGFGFAAPRHPAFEARACLLWDGQVVGQIRSERKHMRSLTAFFVLLVVFMSPGLLVHAQGTQPASKTDGPTPAGATKEEVNQLRSEVAAQRKTIEELKTMVQQLVEAKAQPADGSTSRGKACCRDQPATYGAARKCRCRQRRPPREHRSGST